MEMTNARALGYVDPALEGQNITFICPSPRQEISGPNSSICMENGEWDPDPGNVECTGECLILHYFVCVMIRSSNGPCSFITCRTRINYH